MQLRILSADDVRRALPMKQAIEAMRTAFQALHGEQVTMPVRMALSTTHGINLFMPVFVSSTGGLGQKVVSIYGDNPEQNLPTIHALVTVFDADTGIPRAVIEGTYLTALRTGAVSGLATELMAREDARVLTIFGAGGQAPAQIEAVCAVRPIEEVRILSRSESAQQLATRLQEADGSRRYVAETDIESAVRAADIITTVTNSTTPVFPGKWVQPGTHVNAVGSFRPDMQEVDTTLLDRAQVTVDQREAALEEAGDLLVPMASGEWSMNRLHAELREIVAGERPGRADAKQITYFKSCGLAVEDIAAAQRLLETAEAEGLGRLVEL